MFFASSLGDSFRDGEHSGCNQDHCRGRSRQRLCICPLGCICVAQHDWWRRHVVDCRRAAAVQTDFGVDRADASLSYTAVMLGFVLGGPIMGRLSDRMGIETPVALGAVMLGVGFGVASQAAANWQFALAHGLLIGVGGSASFGPVIADVSLWFMRRRGIAVAICSSGSYLAGTIWPLVIQPLAQSIGWRHTYFGIGVFCIMAMLPLTLALRRRTSGAIRDRVLSLRSEPTVLPAGLTPNRLQLLLMLAGGFLLCCDGNASGSHRGLLRGPGVWEREWSPDAIANARNGHYQPAHIRINRRPDRAVIRTLAQLFASSSVPSALLLGGRSDVAVRCDCPVRLGSGRYRPDVHTHCSGILSSGGSWNARGTRAFSDLGRHGDRRLGIRHHIRRNSFISSRISQRFWWNLLNIAIAGWLLVRLPQHRRPAMA